MKTSKCMSCRWYKVMSYCDGHSFNAAKLVCRYAWNDCANVQEHECHYKKKREYPVETGEEVSE